MAPEPRPLPALIGGKYEPIREIAKGGMGTLYEVKHVVTGDRWALKVLRGAEAADARAVERFRVEAQVSARVKDEHIVRVIDAGVAEELHGAFFVVMELLVGHDLAETVGTTPQQPKRVVQWLSDAARGLTKAHAAGIVHRDLKPKNLFLAESEEGPRVLKIVDFGVAKLREKETTGDSTAPGAVVGTPLYMAPEQASGRLGEVGPATDVWAMGVIAFRLLTGKDYWETGSVAQVLGQIAYAPMEGSRARGADLGPAFDAWFARSCARDPKDRFSSVREQVLALAEALGVEAPLMPVTPLARQHPERMDRTRDLTAKPASPPRREAVVDSIDASTAEPRPLSPARLLPFVGASGIIAVVVALLATRGSLAPASGSSSSTAAAVSMTSAPSTGLTASPSNTIAPVSSASASGSSSLARPPPSARTTTRPSPSSSAPPQAAPRPSIERSEIDPLVDPD